MNYIDHYKNHLTDVIHIDEDKFEIPKLFQTVVQINTYTEMKLVFLEGIFKTDRQTQPSCLFHHAIDFKK